MCQQLIHPLVCHIAYPTQHYHISQLKTKNCHITVRSYRLYYQLPHQHYTDYTVSKILLVWKNEQNTISHSYDIRLNPLKLHWDREDEAYARVHFEAILSTLIFEHILIPWITPPPIRKLLDLQKTTFSLSEDEGTVL